VDLVTNNDNLMSDREAFLDYMRELTIRSDSRLADVMSTVDDGAIGSSSGGSNSVGGAITLE